MNDTIVVFEEHSARIYHGANEQDFFSCNYLVNPKLPPGAPPHHWKNVDGKIEVMSEEEKTIREEYWAKYMKTALETKGVCFSEAQLIQIDAIFTKRFTIGFFLLVTPSVIALSAATVWLLKWLHLSQF